MTDATRTDALTPMGDIQVRQTREFIAGLEQGSQTYWDMVQVGDELSRELHLTPELVILYSDGVEDYNPWYQGWAMIHTFHDSEILAPIPVGATVRITTRAADKYEKRGRRYVRHAVTVEDVESGKLYFRETRDILSL